MLEWGAGRICALGGLFLLIVLALALGWDEALAAKRAVWAAGRYTWLWGEAAFHMGQGAVQIPPLAIITIWAFYRGRSKAAGVGLAGLSSVIFSGLVVQVIKHLVGRPRPRLPESGWEPFASALQMDFNAFPSGHTTTSFALAASLACHFPRLAWLFYLLAGFVAVGRVFSGSHHLSDVAGGAMAGLVMGWVLGQASLRWLKLAGKTNS